MAPRPDEETWAILLKAFSEHGGSVRKVIAATGIDRATVAQAWAKGWPGIPPKRAVKDAEGNVLEPAAAGVDAVLAIHDIQDRARIHARRSRERIYKDTVKAQVQFAKDATDDLMRQRSLEALAVRTSLLLGDQAVKNALALQLATVPIYEQVAVKIQNMADDPDRSAGSMMKMLREVSEIGRLATQQLEASMVMERKHLGKPEAIYGSETNRTPDDLAKDLMRIMAKAMALKTGEVNAALEAHVIDVVPLDLQGEEQTAPPVRGATGTVLIQEDL